VSLITLDPIETGETLSTMELVYLILFHKNIEQLLQEIAALDGPSVAFVIHVCKNYPKKGHDLLCDKLSDRENVVFCERARGTWGSFGMSQGTLNAIQTALIEFDHFEHVMLLSGQDYPIKDQQTILDFFRKFPNKGFFSHRPIASKLESDEEYVHPIKHGRTSRDERVRYQFYNLRLFRNITIRLHRELAPAHTQKLLASVISRVRGLVCKIIPLRKFPAGYQPYLGSAWFALSREQCEFLVEHSTKKSELYQYMHSVYNPEEMFVHTLLKNSKFKDSIVNDELHYIVWGDYVSHPNVLTMKDLPEIKLAGDSQLFARKFDAKLDEEVMREIDAQLLTKN